MRAYCSSVRVYVFVWRLLLIACVGMACARRIPLPPHLAPKGLEDLRARIAAASSPAQRYVAEARLHYVGTDVRLRGTATLAVARPASLRWDLYGPHGGVVQAFATNGYELQLMDIGQSRFIYGQATRANFARLMPVAPLPLDAAEWAALLFGDVTIPDDAELSYSEEAGAFELRWQRHGARVALRVHPETARWTEVSIAVSDTDWGRVVLEARDATGLPRKLRIRTPTADLRVELEDVSVDGEAPTADAFQLDRPDGFVTQHL